jgi:hypothetical protein
VSVQTAVFLALIGNHFLSAVVFLALYPRLVGWTRSEITRHLLFWVTALAAGDAAWLLAGWLRWAWLVYLLFAALLVAGLLGWYRDWLVVRALLAPPPPPSPAEVALADLRAAVLDPCATVEGLRRMVRDGLSPDG